MSGRTKKANGSQSQSLPIAVVGVAAIFPGSSDVGGFWRDIMAGRDLITDVPPTHWIIEDHYNPDPTVPDKTYSKRGAFLSPVEFDPMEFGIPPTNLSSTDTSQLLALIVAKQVLEDAAQGQFSNMDRDRISVILGIAAGLELLGEMVSRLQRPAWVKALRESGIPEDQVESICDRIAGNYAPWKESTFPGLLGNVVAGRIANHFDLGGTNCTVDAACASSFSAMSMAVNELYLGLSDLVITGGVDTTNGPFLYTCFSKTPALSRSDDCCPFSDKSDGMLLGEGIGMVALKRLEDAEQDGDRIYAVLKGIGTSSDGAGTSVYSPVPEGQAKAMRRCYEIAGYSPATVELIEAHGTGTIAGDVAEFEGLRMVFGDVDRKDRQWCALGSIKSQIGHTKSAAGVAGLIKAIMALHNKVLPPTIKVDQPDPRLDLVNSAFYLNTQARPWIRDASYPRRASVSSFGFGGTNFHVAVEEYTGPGNHAWRQRTFPSELVLLGGENEEALTALCQKTAEDSGTPGILPFLARESQKNFNSDFTARMAIVATDETDLEKKLAQAVAAITRKPGEDFSFPNGIHYCSGGAKPGAIAFLFPGQGSQYIGMGADLAMHMDEVRQIWEMAAAIPMEGNIKLHEVVFPRPVFNKDEEDVQIQRLKCTQWAQPAISTTSLAMLALLEALGLRPDCVGGHSLGEITALFGAGILDAASLVRVARKRGELMAEAASIPGTMTAVSQPLEKIQALLEEWKSEVTIANHNGPRQVVLSGPVAAIEQAEKRLGEHRIDSHRLQVSTAFHSSLMSGSCDPFLEFLKDIPFNTPALPIYSNAEAAPYPDDVDKIRGLLAKQINHPVRFVEEIEAMYAAGVRTFVEVGPGYVLTKLVGQCLEGRPHMAVSVDRKGEQGITSLWNSLGRLAINGVAIDFTPLWEDYSPIIDPRQKKKPKIAVPILGCNYGRPYPPPGGAEALPKANPIKATINDTVSVPSQTTAIHKMEKTDMAAAKNTESSRPPCVPAFTPVERPKMTQQPNSGAAPFLRGGNGDHGAAWFKAFQELQRQTAETHAAYQKSLADNHMAFLKAADASTLTLSAMITGQHFNHQETGWSAFSAPMPSPEQRVNISEPPGPAEGMPLQEASPPLTPSGPQTTGPIPAGMDFKELLLSVVAEKTGYPSEILNVDMGLESDLGIDSIKRVEILSAIKDQAPWLPEVDATEMANIRTLGDVLAYMERFSAGAESNEPAGGPTPVKTDAEAAPSDLGRYALKEVSAPHSGFSMAGLVSTGPVFVTDEGTGVAHALVERLKDLEISAQITDDIPDDAEAVIFLGGLRGCADPDAAIAVNREAFLVAKKVAKRLAATGGIFVTVQDTGGDFGLSGRDETRAWLAGLPGLIKTAALEWPKASVKAIDLERGNRSPDELAEALSRELFSGGPDIEVGLHADGTRVRLESYPVALRHLEPTVDDKSVIVASGGARGVTAVTLIELARQFHPRIVLLGRTPLINEPRCCQEALTDGDLKRALLEEAKAEGRTVTPVELGGRTRQILANREIRSTLQDLQEAGSEARYLAVDVQDVSAVTASLESIRREWGPITGIVHGAGVLNDKLIAEKGPELFDPVFNTKVQGLRSLLTATADDPLRMVCLFSSVAARFGNTGQCDYAMANEVLNKVANAEARRRKGTCVVKALNWGPWDGGMVSPALKAHFGEMGIPLIPLDAGARMLIDEIQDGNSAEVEVVIGQALNRGDLSVGVSDRDMILRLLVHQRDYPFFDSHRIKDVPVVPMAMVLEWFLRAAHLCRPDLRFTACKNLQVLRGIRLENFHNGGDRFTLSCRQDSNGGPPALTLELPGADNISHYTATVEMAEPGQAPGQATPNPMLKELKPWTLKLSEIYNEQLFHGPDFHVIRSLEGVSDNAASAVLAGTKEMGWPGGIWKADVAALDGGLQLAILWGSHVLGRPSLPTRIGAYLSPQEGLVEGPIRCELQGRAIRNERTISDLSFFNEKGELVAKMCDVEMHMLPGSGSGSPEAR